MIHEDQYDIVAQRRISHDNLLWQTPVLSLTAQAFLFTTAFDESLTLGARLPAGLLIVIVAAASMQLMCKHRRHEVHSSKLLAEYEEGLSKSADHRLEVVHGRLPNGGISSYFVWQAVLVLFLAAGLWAITWALL